MRLPLGQTTVTVKLISPVTFGPSILNRFMAPPVPGLPTFESVPSNCFLLEPPSGRKLVWDLGTRSDYQNYSPKIAEYIPTTKYNIRLHGDVADVIRKGGIDLQKIEAVIWIRFHSQPISLLATARSRLEVSQAGFQALVNIEDSYDHVMGRNLREIDFEGSNTLRIGRFPAFDFFGDGSFYLLDSPGHTVGHLCGLVRTTVYPDTFILPGGDVCHYYGLMRPSTHLPRPESITSHPFQPQSSAPLCPGHTFEELQKSRGREPTDTLFNMTFGHDIPLASNTVKWLQELDCNEDRFVIIAHDSHVEQLVDHFPKSLNLWKEKGWGTKARWAWLRELKQYFDSKGVSS